MLRTDVLLRIFCLAAVFATAAVGSARAGDPSKAAAKDAKREADRHFKNGVTLYKEGKFDEALAEFERAYEIAPHPLVLYNIAASHRELSHYAESVAFFERFLAEGEGKVPAARLATARRELDAILGRVARVTITVQPSAGATLVVDGKDLGAVPSTPVILSPGEHRVEVRAEGHQPAERTVRVASGDDLVVDLALEALPAVSAEPGPGPELAPAPGPGPVSVSDGPTVGARARPGRPALFLFARRRV